MMSRLQRMAMRCARLPAFYVGLGLVLLTLYVNVHSIPVTSPTQASSATAGSTRGELRTTIPTLQREGTLVANVRGHFELGGERARFVDARTGATYVCLENQVLQQIAIATSRQTTVGTDWIVRGTLTEFDGTNFLLLDRAIRSR
ncbi:MAG: hypothetical protein ACK5OB_18155 [Pirellula sp.]